MRKGLIYKMTNAITGEAYIGATRETAQERMTRHFTKTRLGKHKFAQSLKLFGRLDWTIEVLENDIDETILGYKEIFYMMYYDTVANGLNTDYYGRSPQQQGRTYTVINTKTDEVFYNQDLREAMDVSGLCSASVYYSYHNGSTVKHFKIQ